MRLLKLTLFAALAILLAACSKGGLLNLDRSPAGFRQLSGAEFVSSSAAYDTTLLNGYHVQQSVGDMVPDLEQTSISNGYHFYSTVQGVMLSQ